MKFLDPAFPQGNAPGLDLRTYIATAALQALIASGDARTSEPLARHAVVYADALLAELAK